MRLSLVPFWKPWPLFGFLCVMRGINSPLFQSCYSSLAPLLDSFAVGLLLAILLRLELLKTWQSWVLDLSKVSWPDAVFFFMFLFFSFQILMAFRSALLLLVVAQLHGASSLEIKSQQHRHAAAAPAATQQQQHQQQPHRIRERNLDHGEDDCEKIHPLIST